jgi:hypothetical protein
LVRAHQRRQPAPTIDQAARSESPAATAPFMVSERPQVSRLGCPGRAAVLRAPQNEQSTHGRRPAPTDGALTARCADAHDGSAKHISTSAHCQVMRLEFSVPPSRRDVGVFHASPRWYAGMRPISPHTSHGAFGVFRAALQERLAFSIQALQRWPRKIQTHRM